MTILLIMKLNVVASVINAFINIIDYQLHKDLEPEQNYKDYIMLGCLPILSFIMLLITIYEIICRTFNIK